MADQTDTNQIRSILQQYAQNKSTLTYKALANLLQLSPPGTISQVTALLEACQEDDALLEQPQLAAIAVQKNGAPYPRPGFFQKLKDLNIYKGPDNGLQAQMWHQNELEKVYIYYRD